MGWRFATSDLAPLLAAEGTAPQGQLGHTIRDNAGVSEEVA
jgi:hypothetical protein